MGRGAMRENAWGSGSRSDHGQQCNESADDDHGLTQAEEEDGVSTAWREHGRTDLV